MTQKVYILYENEAWMPPLEHELGRAGLEFEKWHMDSFFFDINSTPPEGIFVNRMSPSSHTRGNSNSVDCTLNCLYWLEAHDRTVINGSHVFQLEISKVKQYSLLEKMGIKTPHTIAVSDNSDALKAVSHKISTPFITKHNRGGKGLGVKLFQTKESFLDYAENFEPSSDHITLLQEYVKPKHDRITRVELVGTEFLYAINVSTAQGFELCPSDACEIGEQFCPAGEETQKGNRQELFSLRENFDHPIIQQYLDFMRKYNIDIAGIEFIEN